MHTHDNTSRMQRPSGGCSNCGGPVRTHKPVHGWTCANCVRDIESAARP
jgi:hypothetical protein